MACLRLTLNGRSGRPLTHSLPAPVNAIQRSSIRPSGVAIGREKGVAVPSDLTRRLCAASHKRRGMNGLARQVQKGLGRDPFAGDVFVFRGRSGSLIKALWHDGVGLSLYAKRLDRGRFVWPQTVDGVVALTAGQMSYLLEAIVWRNPQHRSPGACRLGDNL